MRNFLENVEYTAIPLHPDIIASVPRENQQILWVGCTDGQTIETDVINVPRSEMFVHRNLGNLLSNGELSSLGAIDYCMRIIEVNHIIICGHYGCQVIKSGPPVVDTWLDDLPKLQQLAERFYDKDKGPRERDRRLVELNVLAQMFYVKQQESVAKAIRDRGVQVHGFVFNTDNRECVRLLLPPR